MSGYETDGKPEGEEELYAGHTPIGKLLIELYKVADARKSGRLPSTGGAAYAVFQTGALNPAHRGHIEMLAAARDAMTKKGLAVVAGWVGPTGDWYVPSKARRTSDPPPRMLFDKLDRLKVTQMIIDASSHREWLDADGWDIFVDGYDFSPHLAQVQSALDKEPAVQQALQLAGFERLQVVYVMGDDHFRRCCSHWKTAVVVGRADITGDQEKQMLERAQRFESFVYTKAMGEVADTSSTKFRKALVANRFDDKFCPRDAWDYLMARLKDAMQKCPQ